MKLKVTILQQRSNKNAIGFRVKDGAKEIWEVRDCYIKERNMQPFESYYGALAVAKGGFNEGHPVHLNQIRQDNWELWIDEPNE